MHHDFVAKNYSRPETEVLSEELFRTDMMPKDSISMADISWRKLFTDAQLVQHIETGLQNNIDIRVALQQIEQVMLTIVKKSRVLSYPKCTNSSYSSRIE